MPTPMVTRTSTSAGPSVRSSETDLYMKDGKRDQATVVTMDWCNALLVCVDVNQRSVARDAARWAEQSWSPHQALLATASSAIPAMERSSRIRTVGCGASLMGVVCSAPVCSLRVS
jgi:hypothetical protein